MNLWNELWGLENWNYLRDIQDDLDRIFENRMGRLRETALPLINIWGSQDEILVTAEVPGLTPGDLKVSLNNDTLEISGAGKREEVPDERFHRQERPAGEFTRQIRIPVRVDADRIEASCQHGVLRVRLPRTASDKPRAIPVKAS